MANPELTKDVKKLGENISSFTNSEARIIDFDTKEPSVKVELYFKTGFYKGETFIFQVLLDPTYPLRRQEVIFLTRIFHPAVDDGGNICVQGFTGCGTLEQIVKDIYYQIKNPNFGYYCPLFYDDSKAESVQRAEFAEDVRMSFKVDEILAKMNALGKNVVKPE